MHVVDVRNRIIIQRVTRSRRRLFKLLVAQGYFFGCLQHVFGQ